MNTYRISVRVVDYFESIGMVMAEAHSGYDPVVLSYNEDESFVVFWIKPQLAEIRFYFKISRRYMCHNEDLRKRILLRLCSNLLFAPTSLFNVSGVSRCRHAQCNECNAMSCRARCSCDEFVSIRTIMLSGRISFQFWNSVPLISQPLTL